MNYYFITGVSRGIGKALASAILEDENNYVIGLGRSAGWKHERFEFVSIDLTKTDLVSKYKFIEIIDAESITLVNNSGRIGPVDYVGRLDNDLIIGTFKLNSLAPVLLMNNFAKTYQKFEGRKLVLNISSGAGRHTVESWSSYCSTKSALDMFTEVAENEQQKHFKKNPIKFLSVAPGIVDTKMQDEIREVGQDRFYDVDRFINYKNDNLLMEPEHVARILLQVIENSSGFSNPILDVRELNL